MKFLRKFNEVIDNEILIDNLYDICLELQDGGYEIFVMNAQPAHQLAGVLCIKYKHGNGEFDYSDVKEVIDRTKRYLGDKIISTNVESDWKWYSEKDYQKRNLIAGLIDQIRAVKIYFNW